jgi:hypothetical protein
MLFRLVERNSHESGLKCGLLQDYRTIFRLPQAFEREVAPFAPVFAADCERPGGGRWQAPRCNRVRQAGATARVESADSRVL